MLCTTTQSHRTAPLSPSAAGERARVGAVEMERVGGSEGNKTTKQDTLA